MMASALEFRGESLEKRRRITQAVEVYNEALRYEVHEPCTLILIYTDLRKAYKAMFDLSEMKQIKLYFLDLELESVDKLLFYMPQSDRRQKEIIAEGAVFFSRLRLILQDETSADKVGYLEKLFMGMNALNADFRCRLCWQIAKAYTKQTIQKTDAKDIKGAFQNC